MRKTWDKCVIARDLQAICSTMLCLSLSLSLFIIISHSLLLSNYCLNKLCCRYAHIIDTINHSINPDIWQLKCQYFGMTAHAITIHMKIESEIVIKSMRWFIFLCCVCIYAILLSIWWWWRDMGCARVINIFEMMLLSSSCVTATINIKFKSNVRLYAWMFRLIASLSEMCVTFPSGKRKWHTIPWACFCEKWHRKFNIFFFGWT